MNQGTSDWAATSRALRYDPAEDSWDTLANMNQARALFSASIVDNKIYAIGGIDQKAGTLFDAVEAYDPVLDQWTLMNPAPTKISLHSSIAFNDRIWLMSGTPVASDTYIDSVYIYSPASDSWSTSINEDLPSVNFWGPMLVTHDEKVYLHSGSSGISFGDMAEVIEFDFPVARTRDGTISTNNTIEFFFYEDGDIFVTPSGTVADKMFIQSASILQVTGVAGQTTSLQIDTPGSYWVYGIADDGRLDHGYSSILIESTSNHNYDMLSDFRFYPNPARDFLTIDLPFTGDICLVDILGRELTAIPDVMGNITIPVSEILEGVYFLKVSNGTNCQVERVVVE